MRPPARAHCGRGVGRVVAMDVLRRDQPRRRGGQADAPAVWKRVGNVGQRGAMVVPPRPHLKSERIRLSETPIRYYVSVLIDVFSPPLTVSAQCILIFLCTILWSLLEHLRRSPSSLYELCAQNSPKWATPTKLVSVRDCNFSASLLVLLYVSLL